jgi:plasmid stabilization system protein ParE
VARRILITIPRAQRQIAAARDWWSENREKAPFAFDEDLQNAYALIVEHAHAGVIVRETSSRRTRRLYLARIRYYLYYEVSERAIIVIRLRHSSRRPRRGL